jgi:quercetin dioxygenase-like cupin family protein
MTVSILRSCVAFAIATAATGAAVLGAAQQTPPPTVRAFKTFTVTSAPPLPWDVYLTLASLSAGFWTGPHTHSGPEFGLIVSGQAVRWDPGRQRVANAGDGYFAPANGLHEGGATVDGTLQLSVHLIPRGGTFQTVATGPDVPANAPKAAPSQTRLFQTKYEISDAPAVPFRMTEEILDFSPGTVYTATARDGLDVVTVTGGRLTVTRAGVSSVQKAGDSWTKQAGETLVLQNDGPAPASLMMAAFFPASR